MTMVMRLSGSRESRIEYVVTVLKVSIVAILSEVYRMMSTTFRTVLYQREGLILL